MKVTGISINSNVECEHQVTHELLASIFAKFSRSNEGIDEIMKKVDKTNPDSSIDRIFKFIDYGHASIGGLTSGIPIAIDNVSMWLAYKLFEICQLCDGQESSTRYIKMDVSSLPDPKDIGVPDDLCDSWKSVMGRCFDAYHFESDQLAQLAEKEPSRVKLPPNPSKLLKERLVKNYALDRSRYFIPFATRTNVAIIQTARMWAETIKHLASMPQKEARELAELLRIEVSKFSPRLMKHSYEEKSYLEQCNLELETSLSLALEHLSYECKSDNPWLKINKDTPPFLPFQQNTEDGLKYKGNRYGRCGSSIRRTQVSFAWESIAVAELRDLNRHRTGHRYSPLIQNGFYTPPEINRDNHKQLLEDQLDLLRKLLERKSPAYVYCLLLGSQTYFEHSTHLDKFIYEVELRTGLGAHFRYAEHMKGLLDQLYQQDSQLEWFINVGTAEPE